MSKFTIVVWLLFSAVACAPAPATPMPPAMPPRAALTPAPSATLVPPAAPSVPTSTPRATETSTPTATVRPAATPTQTPCATLRECADRKQVQVGTYLNGAWFPDPRFKDIVATEFNLAVISSGFYWDSIEPSRGQFDFSAVDEQLAFAKSRNMQTGGHALLLAESPYIPDWLAKGNFSRDELEQVLRQFIVQVMTRYKGQFDMYIVVEDPPIPPDTGRDVFFHQFGYDYIDLAFQIARETDPSAILLYNAAGDETPNGTATGLTRSIVQRLKAKGLVDGVGMEMHLDAMTAPSKEDVSATMQSYGLPVYITEMDVGLKDVPGTLEERYTRQAQVYGDMFSACLESGVCKSFSVWGIGDKYSWLERESADADPTLFDDDLKPKPAYFALLDALR